MYVLQPKLSGAVTKKSVVSVLTLYITFSFYLSDFSENVLKTCPSEKWTKIIFNNFFIFVAVVATISLIEYLIWCFV